MSILGQVDLIWVVFGMGHIQVQLIRVGLSDSASVSNCCFSSENGVSNQVLSGRVGGFILPTLNCKGPDRVRYAYLLFFFPQISFEYSRNA